jgi:hypothetical protein
VRYVFAGLLSLLLFSLPSSALGDPEPAPVAVATAEPAPSLDLVEVGQDQPAPFAGILMTQEKALAYARLSLDVDEARGRLGVRERLLAEVTEQLAEAQGAAGEADDPGWWARNGFTVGFVVGAVATGVLVWGAVEVLKARE